MATKFAPNTVEELKELLKNDTKVKVAGASYEFVLLLAI